ncbi:hypothetical protein BBP40_007146 [Aspergillus hancockii]|nr:hypothetical protein BBP40_007146 [Aspergillus hancockii]
MVRGRWYPAFTNGMERPYDQKPDNDVNRRGDLLCIIPDFAINDDSLEKLSADRQIEYGADTDGAKKANERCLEKTLYLADILVHRKDDRHSANEQDQDTQED